MRPKGLKDVAVLAETKPHGTRLKYMAGCRCLPCRVANSQYENDRARARSTGEWNGLVSALPARRHILRLSKQGVGRRAVSAACDVSATIIAAIRSGRRTQIRKRTQDKILEVTRQAVSDAALVPAHETWQQIHTLLEEGFTKAELARRLGIGGAVLQLGKDKILARTAARIDRLFRMLMKE
jgi:hypothetical protein